ncbi:MAG: hypothetical protein EXQ96_01950 [Alphaproteobacteria bacterium]|nr:hypothetical protein [Alphaproteobacteria bacterium]
MELLRDRRVGQALVIAGVLFNNWVYLNDIVLDKHEGFIWLGELGYAGVVAGLVAIVAGLWVMLRAASTAPPA